MKYIKQISTGKAVHRESPHSDKTLGNAVLATGISESDLQVADESITDEQWTIKVNDELPWTTKMDNSDRVMMPRFLEDLITSNPSLVIPPVMKKRYDDKIKIRATKP
jgi:hypothetical protein